MMRVPSFAVVLVLALALGACGSHESSAPAAEPSSAEPAGANAKPSPATAAPGQTPTAVPAAPIAPPDPSLPVSKRILGKWRMDIARVPDTALTEEFRKLKKQGKADSLLITYTITDTEFSLEAFGAKSIWRNRFGYEILKEEGDTLLLKKTANDGKTSEIGVFLKPNDELVIGAGNGQVPLQRIGLPERAR